MVKQKEAIDKNGFSAKYSPDKKSVSEQIKMII